MGRESLAKLAGIEPQGVSTPMRINLILPYLNYTGGMRVLAAYAHRLQQRGHTVAVRAVPRPEPGLRDKLERWWRGQGWFNGKKGGSHFDGLAVDQRIIERPRAIEDADVPDGDVVVATWWRTAEWVARLSDRKGAKAYFMQHHEAFPGQPVDRVNATWRLPMHKIVVAQWLAASAAADGDLDVSVVGNGVDLNQFYGSAREKRSRPRVGFMYSRSPIKGCDITIDAIERARRKIPDLDVVAVGTQQPGRDLKLPTGTQYTRRPSTAQLRAAYSSCDAWLVGSRSEGFGLPLLEAMACRTPVVATPTGAAPELLADGGGALVERDAPEAMAEEIERVARMDEARWRDISDTAFRTAQDHDWEAATERFETALAHAVRRAERGEIAGGVRMKEAH